MPGGTVEWCEFKAEKDGVILTASIPKGDWVLDELIMLLKITNVSAKTLVYGGMRPLDLPSFDICIMNQINERVPLTLRGALLWHYQLPPKKQPHIIGSWVEEELRPKEELHFRAKFSDYFLITQPGVYRLSIRWDAWLGRFPSKDREPGPDVELKDICLKASKPHWFSRKLIMSLYEEPNQTK